MNALTAYLYRFPLISVITIILICLGIFSLESYSGITGPVAKDMLHSSLQTTFTVLILFALVSLNWLEKSGLTTPFGQWHPLWWVAAIPMAFIGLINALSIEWDTLSFNIPSFAAWAFNSVSTGMFEETLLRGFCFCLLLTAWKGRSNAIYKAAFAQAILFGLAHLNNLQDGLIVDVYPQVIYATLFGIGFAGIVAYTKSIWPAIGVHTVINGLSDVNNYFVPGYVRTPPESGDYIGAVIVIFIVSALPGLFMLHKAQKRSASSTD